MEHVSWLHLLVATFPVLAFLLVLIFLDSYKLVHLRPLLASIAFGAGAALIAFALNTVAADVLPLSPHFIRRYVAPVIEEILKAMRIMALVRSGAVGFNVDAAIHGFAAGAGFACLENINYLMQLPDAALALWIVRGLGTALMHGTVTAIFATVSKSLLDRRPTHTKLAFLPGLAGAIVLHSLYNHVLIHPLAMTGLLLVVLPLVFITIFERSAQRTRQWLGTGFDHDSDLLEMLTTGDVRSSPVGLYLQALRARFSPDVVVDMLCYLQIYVELSLRAKTLLIANRAGLPLDFGDDLRASLIELEVLEKSIGRTGKLALQPFLSLSRRDLWQIALLRRGAPRATTEAAPGTVENRPA